ncbi:MAG: glycosyltransferase family 9 protein [Xanthomonadaceae bacterium]|nr:glycosyltransferase family 9 protein [Xanthomonadaceae bacterium]
MNTALTTRAEVRRILIIKWSALGDAAIASAIMEDIRRAFPAAAIHLNTLPSAARLFAHDPRFHDIVAIDVRDRKHRFRRHIEWLRRVRAGRYDLLVDLQRTDHTRILLALLLLTGHRIPRRWGRRGGFPYTVQPGDRDPKTHVFHSMRSMLAAAGIAADTERPVLHVPAAARGQALATLSRHGLQPLRFAVFLPGSQAGSRLKRWGAGRYAELGKLLRARGIARIAVIGGPEEVEECAAIVDAINANDGAAAVNLNMLPLLQIIPVCEAASCIVANDTGNAHIAAAADRPMVMICGPTDPRRVKPMGRKVRAVQAELDCVNCYGKACRVATEPVCMERISAECIAGLLLDAGTSCRGVRVF